MQTTVDLAMWKPIDQYRPQIGDTIIWHGWVVSHWYGIISEINNDGTLKVVTAGIPSLLFDKQKKHKDIKLNDIVNSVGGEYSVIRSIGNSTLWFVS